MRAAASVSARYAAAGSLVLAALAAAPATPASALPPGPDDARARGTALAAERAAATGIRFGACPAAEHLPEPVTCGTVTVPLDYARPDGRTIRLTVSRIRATGRAGGEKVARQGSFVFNPGGPGGNGMYFPLAGMMSEWKRIGAAYDLVGYAPRGVGRSAPLSCRDPKDPRDPNNTAGGPTQAPTYPSQADKQERIARAKAYARGCARHNPDLEHYTTQNNARDLDVLRAALGERRLTYMGASYGTYIGAVYATLFPSHVRRMVFDSAVDPSPGNVWYSNNLAQSAAFEQRWADFRAWVARHDDTYGLGTTPEAVQRAYEEVRAELARTPAGKKVGPGELQSAFLQAGYYDDYWPLRALALSEYRAGNPEPLIAQAAPVSSDIAAKENENASAVYTAVECNDAPWPTDFRTWDRDNTRLARVAPFETWDNVWTNLPCAYWSGPRQQPTDVRTLPGALPPTLILAAERDAATPYAGAKEMHRRIAGSVLVTERDAGTHGIGGGTNACVNGHLDAYVLDGRLPARRSASCAAHAEPAPLGSGGPPERAVRAR